MTTGLQGTPKSDAHSWDTLVARFVNQEVIEVSYCKWKISPSRVPIMSREGVCITF